jgi:hypothetical protein
MSLLDEGVADQGCTTAARLWEPSKYKRGFLCMEPKLSDVGPTTRDKVFFNILLLWRQ